MQIRFYSLRGVELFARVAETVNLDSFKLQVINELKN